MPPLPARLHVSLTGDYVSLDAYKPGGWIRESPLRVSTVSPSPAPALVLQPTSLAAAVQPRTSVPPSSAPLVGALRPVGRPVQSLPLVFGPTNRSTSGALPFPPCLLDSADGAVTISTVLSCGILQPSCRIGLRVMPLPCLSRSSADVGCCTEPPQPSDLKFSPVGRSTPPTQPLPKVQSGFGLVPRPPLLPKAPPPLPQPAASSSTPSGPPPPSSPPSPKRVRTDSNRAQRDPRRRRPDPPLAEACFSRVQESSGGGGDCWFLAFIGTWATDTHRL